MRESAALLEPNGAASSHTVRDYTSNTMALEFDDSTLLRGVTADVILKGGSEIFSSNVLDDAQVAALHKTTDVVAALDDFISRELWCTRQSWNHANLEPYPPTSTSNFTHVHEFPNITRGSR